MDLIVVLLSINFIFLIALFFKKNIISRDQLSALEKAQERTERIVREDILKNREELSRTLNDFSGIFSKQVSLMSDRTEKRLEDMRLVIERQIKHLQEENTHKLDQMREVVDEKLQSTLEKRLGESFKLVSERLEKVHQGLGEMQTLASGVGDLKRVLSNVKTRGVLGEVQLANLLEQVLAPEQYERNVHIKANGEAVEFAIKFSSKDDKNVYLPIDSKFPLEDYERLVIAQEKGDLIALAEAEKSLIQRIKFEAKKIKEKYIDPPTTTDFGILFLPTEGLFAEVLRQPGLYEQLQRDYQIAVAGPTTIAAILNSFHMGFRTLAVQKRASEVWEVLALVKNDFKKFGDMLDKTQKKLQEASNTIEEAATKSRTLEKKLNKVQQLSQDEDINLIETL